MTCQTSCKYVLYSLSYSESQEEQGYSQGPLICDMSLLSSHRSAQKIVLLFEPCWTSQLSRSLPGNFHFVFDCLYWCFPQLSSAWVPPIIGHTIILNFCLGYMYLLLLHRPIRFFCLFFFFFFFYTRQKFSSALATLKFSQISLSFLLLKEDIFIIKGPWCRYCVWSPHLIIHLSLLLQFSESDGCVKQLRHMCCQYWLYYTYCL